MSPGNPRHPLPPNAESSAPRPTKISPNTTNPIPITITARPMPPTVRFQISNQFVAKLPKSTL